MPSPQGELTDRRLRADFGQLALAENPVTAALSDLAGADLRVPTRYYVRLLEQIGGISGSHRQLLAQAGLEPAMLDSPTLSLAEAAALVEAVLAQCPQPHLGFELGRSFRPSDHELIGYALLSAGTLAEAMRLAARYWRLITPVYSMAAAITPNHLELNWRPLAQLPAALQRLHGEAIIAGVHNELRLLLDEEPGGELRLPATWLRGAHPYAGLQGTRCRAADNDEDASVLRWTLRPALGARPLRLADPAGLARARQRCEALLRNLTEAGSVAQWVRLMIAQADDHQPSQTELARLLNLSARSLHRRLGAEGESFQQLAQQERMSRARRLLRETPLSLIEIALRLGYTDAGNFSRAFRRAQRCTPGQYRHSARDSA